MYLSVFLALQPLTAAEPAVPKLSVAFLETHCLGCHSAEGKAGHLDLDKLLATADLTPHFDSWVKVFDRVKSGEMPPPKEVKPSVAERDAMLKDLAESLTANEVAQRAKNGRTALRRLNRTEFENTLRDLLQLPGLRVKDLLPEDGRAYGYDRSAAALDLSPILMAKYSEAVDHALDCAIAPWSTPPETLRVRQYASEQYDYKVLSGGGDVVFLKDFKYDPRFPIPKDSDYGGKYSGLTQADREGLYREPSTIGIFRQNDESFGGRFHFAPVHPGFYRFTISVWSYWWDKGDVKPSHRSGMASLLLGGRQLGQFDAPSLKPAVHTVEQWLEPGGQLRLNTPSLWPVHVYNMKGRASEYVGPGIAVDWIDIAGPLNDEWPPPSHRRLFADLPMTSFEALPVTVAKPKRTLPRHRPGEPDHPAGHLVPGTVRSTTPAADAERCLSAFLPRAFRRPVSQAELARYTALAVNRIGAGACFEDAMRTTYKAVLTSPEFLFLHEPVGPLDDWSLASRLSYFLWNSMPDDTLTAVAAAGRMRSEVRIQTERMLNDPKASRFVTDLADQWLDQRDIELTTPDRRLYPEYGPDLLEAIRHEPREYLHELLRNNHPATTLVQSDFAMVNQRLAEHYSLPGVTGTRFRKVTVPPSAHRGGFLTQAAILKVTANGTTTTPVKRGAWVQRKLLDDPPLPPPPDIAAIEPDVRGTTTIREQLAKHRDHAACAACHVKIDPPGFALESFDVLGGYRDRYRATEGAIVPELVKTYPFLAAPEGAAPQKYSLNYRVGPAVDPSGTTATGQDFKNIDAYRALLAADPRRLARNFAKQMVIYSSGAPISFTDRAALETILDRSGGSYNLRNIILETVQSPLFLTR
ncbi:DUF1592 domain-containing protein [soil metagenome]